MLDTRTVLTTFALNSLVMTIVMCYFWHENHKETEGITLWLIGLVVRTIGMGLVALRGQVPDFFSIPVANLCLASATLITYMGLQRFLGFKPRVVVNIAIISLFAIVFVYFVYVLPDTGKRVMLISIYTAWVYGQCLYLIRVRAPKELKPMTRIIATTCAFYVSVQIFRIILSLVTTYAPDYMDSSVYDAAAQLFNQFLTSVMVFALIMMVNSLNIQKRNRSQEELEKRECRLRTLADFAFDWEFWSREDGSIEYMTPSAVRVTGYPAEEFSQDPGLLERIIHSEDLLLYQSHGKTDPCRLQFRILHRDGEVRWIEHACQAVFDPNGVAMGRRASNRDITQRKYVEAELQRSAAKVYELYNSAPCGYHSTDRDGLFININDTELNWLGYNREEVIGKLRLSDLLAPENLAQMQVLKERILEVGSMNDLRVDLICGDGSVLPVIMNVKAVYEKGCYQYCNATLFNRTEINSIENELRGAKAKADQASQAKSDFLSRVSHELRTPLNSIIALSGMLERGLVNQISAIQQEYLTIIGQSGKTLLELINDILDISRVESGRVEVVSEKFDIAALVRDSADLLQPLAVQKGLALTLQNTDHRVIVESDSNKISHILQNIIGNAIKFTDVGSVAIVLHRHGESVQISVSDTGIGIASEYIPHIFDEFRQADTSTNRKYGGTGLGLAISKKYTELLNGSITVESTLGKGSVFTIGIPIRFHSAMREDASNG